MVDSARVPSTACKQRRHGVAKSYSQGRKPLDCNVTKAQAPEERHREESKTMPSTYTNLLYHIVFSTKQRKPLITDNVKEELYRYIGGIIRAEGGIQLEIGGISDHVHILPR